MTYSEMQKSAIQEIANIGTGNAATALSGMIGVSIDIEPPVLDIVPLGEATERVGPPERPIIGVLTPVVGDVPANILLAFSFEAAASLCGLLGCDPLSEMGRSALQEMGNILTSSYVTAIGQMVGLTLEPAPPAVAVDMLGAIVDGVLAYAGMAEDSVLFLQTSMHVEGAYCDFGFLYVPDSDAVGVLLAALGMA